MRLKKLKNKMKHFMKLLMKINLHKIIISKIKVKYQQVVQGKDLLQKTSIQDLKIQHFIIGIGIMEI